MRRSSRVPRDLIVIGNARVFRPIIDRWRHGQNMWIRLSRYVNTNRVKKWKKKEIPVSMIIISHLSWNEGIRTGMDYTYSCNSISLGHRTITMIKAMKIIMTMMIITIEIPLRSLCRKHYVMISWKWAGNYWALPSDLLCI